MNRYRNAPGLRAGPSKASATTLCQKCLKRGHYSYECKATAQERPYKARPSRTQQLMNPRLMPKLSEDVPEDLQRTTGVADEILAKREAERGRKRDLDKEDSEDRYGKSPKRARSLSTGSTDSVSTISTNRSVSASPQRHSRQGSRASGRRGSASPPPSETRKRRYSVASDGYSAKSYSSDERQRSRSREWTDDRNIRRRRRESSPEERGRNRESRTHGVQRSDRRSQSVDKGRIAKERRSMTPNATHDRSKKRTYRDREPLRGPSHGGRSGQDPRTRGGQPREGSLSPYSKRLALTQSMGR